jgi:hypothetical protein
MSHAIFLVSCGVHLIIFTIDIQLSLTSNASCSELNIFLDVEFLDVWRTWAFDNSIRAPKEPSPFFSLAEILSRSPLLKTLRIRVAELAGLRSAWTRSPKLRINSIPIGHAMEHALSSIPKFRLSSLGVLELDVFNDIEPLLCLAPNLDTLRLSMSFGFTQNVNQDLVDSLKHIPRLRELSYTAGSLRLTSFLSGIEQELEAWEDPLENAGSDKESSVELLKAIGEALPHLEILDLQARQYGAAIRFISSAEPISPEVVSHPSDFALSSHTDICHVIGTRGCSRTLTES